MAQTEPLWGIDLGGTKIEGVVLSSAQEPESICRMRIPTEADQGYQHVLHRIHKLLQMMSDEVGRQPEVVGIGTPGTLDPKTQLLKNSNSTSLNGQPFKRDLEAIIQKPLVMANDADCFALAEARMGIVQEVAPDAEVVFGVIMGTGVGGGIVVNGQVLIGKHGIAGEWGHNFLDASGGNCYCGKVGCAEKILSGVALEEYYRQMSGSSKKLKEIVNITESDKHAKATMNRLIHFFGLGISAVINLLDPDIIVLGGGVSNVAALYTEGVKEVEKHTFNPYLETPIVKPKLGDSAGVFGAAMLIAEGT